MHELKNALRARERIGTLMDFEKSTVEERLLQSQSFKRAVLRKIQLKRLQSEHAQRELYGTIASEFLSLPSLDNVDRLSTVYGYAQVRKAIGILDNMVFEEFFYGKILLYPLWLKRFSRIFDAAKPRAQIRELLSSQE